MEKKYICKKCFFKTDRLTDWKRHLKTMKHKHLHFMCSTCDKVFNNRQGLYRHKKNKCIKDESIIKKEMQLEEMKYELVHGLAKNEIMEKLIEENIKLREQLQNIK